jgi:hypothetical protein
LCETIYSDDLSLSDENLEKEQLKYYFVNLPEKKTRIKTEIIKIFKKNFETILRTSINTLILNKFKNTNNFIFENEKKSRFIKIDGETNFEKFTDNLFHHMININMVFLVGNFLEEEDVDSQFKAFNQFQAKVVEQLGGQNEELQQDLTNFENQSIVDEDNQDQLEYDENLNGLMGSIKRMKTRLDNYKTFLEKLDIFKSLSQVIDELSHLWFGQILNSNLNEHIGYLDNQGMVHFDKAYNLALIVENAKPLPEFRTFASFSDVDVFDISQKNPQIYI